VSDLTFTIVGRDQGSRALDDVGDAADRAHDRLDKLGTTGVKVLAALPPAALGAGVAVGGMLGLVAAGFLATGVSIVAGNEQISDSWIELTQTVADGAQKAAEPLIGPLHNALVDVTDLAEEMQPQLADAFGSAVPYVDDLSDGVRGFARGAMPGFVTAVQSGQAPVTGFKSLLIDTGLGVGNMFTNVARASQSSGRILVDTGRVIRDTLGFVGGLLSRLSDSGAPSVERLRQVLWQLYNVALQLGGSGFPVLFSSAGVLLDVLSGLLAFIEPVADQLGAVIGVVLSLAAAFRVMSAVSGGMQALGARVAEFGGAARSAGADAGGAQTRLGGLASFVAGPLGVALGIASVAYGAFSGKQADAARRAEDLASALRASKGAIDENVRSVAAKALQEQGAIEKAKGLGISLATLTDAYLGQGDAAKSLLPNLRAMQNELNNQQVPLQQNASDTKKLVEQMQNKAIAVDALIKLLSENTPANQKAIQEALDLANATAASSSTVGELSLAELANKAATDNLGKAYETLKTNVSDTNARVTALQTILDELTGRNTSYEDSVQGINATLRGLVEGFKGAATSGKGFGAELLNTDGTINTAKANGAQLRDTLKELERNTLAGADAMARNGATQQQVADFVANARDQFISQYEALGLTKEAAGRLADQYGLIPDEVATLILTPGLAEAAHKLGMFDYQVRTLPDGTVIIDAQTSPAQDGINRLIQTNNGRVISIQVQASGDVWALSASGQRVGMPARAMGGPVEAGKPYLVGEKGPELIFPTQDGFVATARETESIMLGARTDSVRAVDPGTAQFEKHFHLHLQTSTSTVSVLDEFRLMEHMAGVM
jgi:hypothetical protein